MPRVSSQKAAKDYPEIGIKKGETYYKWSFRYGGTHKSGKHPRASQLTQSKYSAVYAALEAVEDVCADATSVLQDIVDALSDAANTIHEVAEEYNEADEAMGGNQGVNYERAEACEECATELETVESEYDRLDEFGEGCDYATEDEAREALVDAATAICLNEV